MAGSAPTGRIGEYEDGWGVLVDPTRLGVLVSGGAGVGKTLLADRWSERAEAHGWSTRRIDAVTLAQLDASRRSTTPLGELLAGVDEAAGSESPRSWFVVVDEADAAPPALANELVDAAQQGVVRLVLTIRDDRRLPETFARLVRSGALHRIECGPLDFASTATVADEVAAATLTPSTHQRVFALTNGNPLMIRELMLAAIDEQLLERHGDIVELAAIPVRSVRLFDLVADSLDGLSDEDRRTLAVVATSEPAGPAVLMTQVSTDSIERLQAGGHISSVTADRRLAFVVSSPLVGEVLRARQSPLTTRTIRSGVAAAIRALGARRRDDRHLLSRWSLDGDVEVDVPDLVDASAAAHAEGEHQLAERLARAAFDRRPDHDTARALEAPLYELGDPELLDALFERWEPLVRDEAQRAVFESCRASARYWRGADADAPARLVAAAAGFDTELAGELTAHAASLLVTRGDIAWAIELGEPHLRSTSPRAQIHATLATTHGHRAAGHPERALTILDAVLSAYRAVGPEAFILSHSVLSNVEVHALAEAGRFEDAERAGVAAIATGHEADSPTSMGLALLATGWSRVLQGRPDADDMLADAERWLGQARHRGMMRWALLARALGRAQAADVAGASALCHQLDRLGDHPAHVFEATRARIDAWIAFVNGDLGAVERELVAAARSAERVGNVTAELGCLHDLARLGRADVASDRASAIAADGVEGAFLAAQADHVAALAGGDPTRLAASVQELDDLGLGHFAADSAEACARLAAGRGDARGAATWVRRAQELRGASGSTPIVPMRSTALHPLTTRESEIAVLAARGVSNRDMAEQLFVSVRTIGNHLTRIYAKLGVNDRAALAQLLSTAPAD